MDYVRFKYSKKYGYETRDYIGEDDFFHSIYLFLTMTYLDDIKDLRAWMKGEFRMPDGTLYGKPYLNWQEIGVSREGNKYYIDALNNDEICLKKEVFVKLLDDWEKVLNEKPEEVMLKWDGDTVEFEVILI